MYDHKLRGFKQQKYYEWLFKRFKELEYAVANNIPCHSTTDMDLLAYKLLHYRIEVDIIQKQYGIQD